MRNYYIDNLRWMVILLLFPYHGMQIWNGGEGFYIWSHTNTILDAIATMISPWFMTSLFVIAGMSSKYSLQKRTSKQFIEERAKKLLIPFIFGTLILAPVMTYIAEIFFNGYTGSYLSQYYLFFTKKTNLTGYKGGFTPAHFWFLIYLFVISLMALLIINLQKKYFPRLQISNIQYGILILLFIPERLMMPVLDIGGKSIGQFLILFLFGFYIMSEETVLRTLEKYRYISLLLWVISGTFFTYLYALKGVINEGVVILYVLAGWMGILALLGTGRKSLNFHNKISEYFTKASFPIYIIHQVVLVIIGYFTLKLPMSVFMQFGLIVISSFLITIMIYEIVRKIPYVRIVFGINK
jgi:Predicted acyltransferases